jgi:hypothetical protein
MIAKLKILAFTIVFFQSIISVKAQLYNSALGIRLGSTNGISYKTFIKQKAAIEGIGTFRNSGIGLTCLYQVHGIAFKSNDFNWYVGGGGHINSWQAYEKKINGNKRNYALGLDGIIGLEGKFKTVPLAISLDWKPTIDFTNNSGYNGDSVTVSVRYCW